MNFFRNVAREYLNSMMLILRKYFVGILKMNRLLGKVKNEKKQEEKTSENKEETKK